MDLKPILDLSQLAVNVTGIVILGITIWSFRKQMNAQVYLAYTQRYEDLMADCDHDFRSSLLKLRLDQIPEERRDKIKVCMLRYLNLCSEEYHLMKSGYLAKAVWGIWQSELEHTLRTSLYVSGWPELEHEFLSHSDFRRYVEDVQRSPDRKVA
jgi:hypothetical protein